MIGAPAAGCLRQWGAQFSFNTGKASPFLLHSAKDCKKNLSYSEGCCNQNFLKWYTLPVGFAESLVKACACQALCTALWGLSVDDSPEDCPLGRMVGAALAHNCETVSRNDSSTKHNPKSETQSMCS